MDNLLALRLKQAGHSLTQPRALVFNYLAGHPAPTAAQLVLALRGEVDRSTVFRTLALFRDAGIIHDVGVGPKRRVELSDQFSPHHHHLSCRGCGRAVSFSSEPTERLVKRVAGQYGFVLSDHHLELSGYCLDCAPSIG